MQISFPFEFFVFDLKIDFFFLQWCLTQPEDFIGFVPIAQQGPRNDRLDPTRCRTLVTYALLASAVVFIPSLLLSSWFGKEPLRSLLFALVYVVFVGFSFTSQFGRRRTRFRRSRSRSSRARCSSSCCLERRQTSVVSFQAKRFARSYLVISVKAEPSVQFSTNVAPCRWVTNWPSRRRFSIHFCRACLRSRVD